MSNHGHVFSPSGLCINCKESTLDFLTSQQPCRGNAAVANSTTGSGRNQSKSYLCVPRSTVYEAINTERAYQNSRWNRDTTTSANIHSPEEWFMYIEDYVNEAKHILSRTAQQEGYPQAMAIMRKVAGMAVASMEEHGAPRREGFESHIS